MHSADDFIRACGFFLPPFAYWTPADWQGKGVEAREIVTNGLGWDITNFGFGNFKECGLFLFTICNVSSENWKTMPGKLYAEKLTIGKGGRVLIGEVSLVDGDSNDNRFREPTGRFPTIEEDEPPLNLLVTDYKKYYREFNA